VFDPGCAQRNGTPASKDTFLGLVAAINVRAYLAIRIADSSRHTHHGHMTATEYWRVLEGTGLTQSELWAILDSLPPIEPTKPSTVPPSPPPQAETTALAASPPEYFGFPPSAEYFDVEGIPVSLDSVPDSSFSSKAWDTWPPRVFDPDAARRNGKSVKADTFEDKVVYQLCYRHKGRSRARSSPTGCGSTGCGGGSAPGSSCAGTRRRN
jgi:hypothetical protein